MPPPTLLHNGFQSSIVSYSMETDCVRSLVHSVLATVMNRALWTESLERHSFWLTAPF